MAQRGVFTGSHYEEDLGRISEPRRHWERCRRRRRDDRWRRRLTHMVAEGYAMKLIFACLLCVSFSRVGFAAAEQCRAIPSDAVRLACYDRETKVASSRPAQPTPIAPKGKAEENTANPVDQLQVENDRVSARLKGICGGC